MTQEQHDFEMNCAGQAQAEYEQQMDYYKYLDSLIESKQYQLHAIHTVTDMLLSKQFASSGLSVIEYLMCERRKLELK